MLIHLLGQRPVEDKMLTCSSVGLLPQGTCAKLGTSEWLKHSEHVCGELLEGVDTHIQKLTNLDKTCLQVQSV